MRGRRYRPEPGRAWGEEDAHGLDLETQRGELEDPNADQGGWRLDDNAGGNLEAMIVGFGGGMRIRIATFNAENLAAECMSPHTSLALVWVPTRPNTS